MSQLHAGDPLDWATRQFSGVDLGDARLEKRTIHVAAALAGRPGVSIPRLSATWGETKAAYNLFAHPAATPEALQHAHREQVREALGSPGVKLLLEDTTDCSWSGNEPVPGLGPIGTGAKGLQGFQLHTTLAVAWSPEPWQSTGLSRRPAVEVLGVADQEYHVRRARSESEPIASDPRGGARESQLWERATERLGPAPPEASWLRVCDRGADIFSFLKSCQTHGHGFVVRASADRRLEDGEAGQKRLLFPTVRAAESLGSFALELRARPGQAARVAVLEVSATAVRLRSPQRAGAAAGRDPAIACTAVRVFENQPPEGVAPLEWILLCSDAVASFEQAMECTLQYATRWLIEEFHKALKTGLGAERLQLKQAANLFAAIAVMSVVALRLLHLREVGRATPQAPAAHSGLGPTELAVLEAQSGRALKSVSEVLSAVGRLGGHLGRKHDGPPGWLALWRGMDVLLIMVSGFLLAKKILDYG